MLDLKHPTNIYADQRLRHETVIWFSTTRPDGRPHIVPLWFLWDGSTVLIFRPPDSQVVCNLRHNHAVTLALNMKPEEDSIVILEGCAELLTDGTLATMVPAYIEKYISLLLSKGLKAEIIARSYSQAIRITPTRIIG